MSTLSVRRLCHATLLATGAALLTGCGDGGTDAQEDPSRTVEDVPVQLAGNSFVADRVAGYDLVDGSTLTVTFEDEVMAVAAGCNTMFGAYVEEDGQLAWDDEPASTMMECASALAEQDAWLTTLFTEGLSIDRDGDADLVLETGSVRLEFSRQDGGVPSGPQSDPAARDYVARINGPSSAEPGTVVKLTLSNIGRLRDSYRLTATPEVAGVVGPRHLTIEPGRSAKFRLKVKRTPVTIEVESVGAGPEVDAFTIR